MTFMDVILVLVVMAAVGAVAVAATLLSKSGNRRN
jgi:hypothetical protein